MRFIDATLFVLICLYAGVMAFLGCRYFEVGDLLHGVLHSLAVAMLLITARSFIVMHSLGWGLREYVNQCLPEGTEVTSIKRVGDIVVVEARLMKPADFIHVDVDFNFENAILTRPGDDVLATVRVERDKDTP